ncbi:unnamed protein product [Lampetra planeri]
MMPRECINSLFDNFTWTKISGSPAPPGLGRSSVWLHPQVSVFVTLLLFLVMKALSLSSRSCFRRLVGEIMATLFPNGILFDGIVYRILPGGYAVIGAAAMTGAVTHTVSTAVICFELTGQISHILPMMVAVILANMVAQGLQPSLYDSIIQVKKLPYLPELALGHISKYNIFVEDIMESMILLGSIERTELQAVFDWWLSAARRVFERGQSSPGQVSKVSWESFTFVDEEAGGEGADKAASPQDEYKGKLPSVRGALQRLFSFSSSTGQTDAQSVQSVQSVRSVTTNCDWLTQIKVWEEAEMDKPVDMEQIRIDPSPFQLLQKAIEGSTRSGVRLRPPLASFRDASRKAKKHQASPVHPFLPHMGQGPLGGGEQKESELARRSPRRVHTRWARPPEFATLPPPPAARGDGGSSDTTAGDDVSSPAPVSPSTSSPASAPAFSHIRQQPRVFLSRRPDRPTSTRAVTVTSNVAARQRVSAAVMKNRRGKSTDSKEMYDDEIC